MSAAENCPIFKRPGLPDKFLIAAGCVQIDEKDCVRLYGFQAAGIAIPFRTMQGEPIMDAGKPFVRVRLYHPTDSQKYHQRPGSGVHIYVPPGFVDRVKGSTVILCEGEFKALALAEAGYCALGLCGINGAAQKTSDGPALNDELAELILMHRPATVAFLGDSDTVLNDGFSREAAKLRKLFCDNRRFNFVERLVVVQCLADGPKGIDDCRQAQGDKFNQWFDLLLADAFEVHPKSKPTGLFCDLLQRQKETIKPILAGNASDAREHRVKLLQSAAKLQGEPAALLDLKPLLADLLDKKTGEISGLLRDAGGNKDQSAQPEIQQKETDGELQPWPEEVDGRKLLGELVGTFNRYLIIPSPSDILFAVWTLHTYCFDVFSFTPYMQIISPEAACGKSTLAELLQHLCANATTPGGMSAAAMFRRIERTKPTLLLDEWDTLSDETRQASLNVLNTGFKHNGVYTICVGDDHEDKDFHTFCPKALFGLSATKLPDTTRSRCFVVTLQKKLATEKVEKLTRKFSGLEFRQKCLRWANDHREALMASQPAMPEGLSARQEDISEPLLAIADEIGGQWPELLRKAVLHFCGQANIEEGDPKRELLVDIRQGFEQQDPPDRFSSAAMMEYLNNLEHRPWAAWNDGKGITQRQVAERLKCYQVVPRSLKLASGKVARGYYRADFENAFDRYIDKSASTSATTATNPINIEENPPFTSATGGNGSGHENATKPNKYEPGSGVALEMPEKEPMCD